MSTPPPPPPLRSVSSASPTNNRNFRRNEGAEGSRPPPRRAKSNDSSSIPRPRPGVPRSRTAESASKWVRTNTKARGMEGSSREFDHELAEGSTTNIPALSLGAWKSQDDDEDEEHSDNSMSYLPSHQHDMSWRSAVPQRLLDTPSSHQRGSSARTNSRESESSSNMMNDALSNLSMSSVKDAAADTTKTHSAITSALGGYRSDDDLKWLEDDDDASSSRSHNNLNDSISKNMFQALEDLRQVDQSVNLMDPQKAKYEQDSDRRKNPNSSYISGLSQFLKERDRRDKNWDLYHLKSTSTGKRSSGGCLRVFCNLPFLIMVAFMAAAVLIHMMWHNNDRTPTTTSAPISNANTGGTTTTAPNFTSTTTSPTQRTKALEALLESMDPKFDIVSKASPAAREAFTWITAYDPAQVDLSRQKEEALVERFVLATLFFATHPQYNAASRNFVAEHHHTTTQLEKEVVGEDSSSANEENAGRQRRHLLIRNHLQHWMTSFSVCQWEGITCHRDRVTTISLASARLQGTIPPEIGMLCHGSFLRELDLSDNKLEGTVPDTMRQLTSLESLRLEHNTLTGDVSTVVCPLKKRDQANLTFVSSDCDWRVKCGGNNDDDQNDDDGCCDKCY